MPAPYHGLYADEITALVPKAREVVAQAMPNLPAEKVSAIADAMMEDAEGSGKRLLYRVQMRYGWRSEAEAIIETLRDFARANPLVFRTTITPDALEDIREAQKITELGRPLTAAERNAIAKDVKALTQRELDEITATLSLDDWPLDLPPAPKNPWDDPVPTKQEKPTMPTPKPAHLMTDRELNDLLLKDHGISWLKELPSTMKKHRDALRARDMPEQEHPATVAKRKELEKIGPENWTAVQTLAAAHLGLKFDPKKVGTALQAKIDLEREQLKAAQDFQNRQTGNFMNDPPSGPTPVERLRKAHAKT